MIDVRISAAFTVELSLFGVKRLGELPSNAPLASALVMVTFEGSSNHCPLDSPPVASTLPKA